MTLTDKNFLSYQYQISQEKRFWENSLLNTDFHYHYGKQANKVAPVANAWAPRYIATGKPAPVAAAPIADAPAANDAAP